MDPKFQAKLKTLSDEELEFLAYDWESWRRPKQCPPDGDWTTWLILAGRGFGKTRIGAETVRAWVKSGAQHPNMIAATADDLRDIMIEGESGILATCPKDERPTYLVSKRRLDWPNGARSLLFTAEEPDRMRGKQSSHIWADELCFVGDTLVLTEHGENRIDRVRVGERVWTRSGLRTVVNAGVTSESAETFTVVLSNGRVLRGTANHPVMANGRFYMLSQLRRGDTLEAWKTTLSSGMGNAGTGTRTITKTVAGSYCTGRSTLRRMVQSHQMCRSTTKTGTSAIATLTTSKRLPYVSTCVSTNRVGFCSGLWKIVQRLRSKSGRAVCLSRGLASFAVRRLSQRGCVQSSVLQSAMRSTSGTRIRVISVAKDEKRSRVYNLEVSGEHEYYASGVLVHNCAWKYDRDAWDQAKFGLRLGSRPQAIITTTPRPTKIIKEIMADPDTRTTRGTTYENRANLAPAFYSSIIKVYEGTRLGRQELNAEILDDNPGALWILARIDELRVSKPYPLTRIVIAIDPAVTSNEESDETGIVAVGMDAREPEHLYVLDDRSGIYTPHEWAGIAAQMYADWGADRVIGEVNNGGDLIEETLRAANKNLPYTAVRASRGKAVRAEPVSALYEQGRVHHVGSFAKLEDQMTTWNPQTSKDSPDRVDALVWACTELSSGSSGADWIQFVKGEAITAQRKGYIPQSDESKVRVDGSRTDVCSKCGSTFFTRDANGKSKCFKCGEPRP